MAGVTNKVSSARHKNKDKVKKAERKSKEKLHLQNKIVGKGRLQPRSSRLLKV